MVKQFFYSVIAFMGLFLWNGCDSGSDPKSSIGSITSPAKGQKFLAGENIVIQWAGDATNVTITGSPTGQTYNPLTPSTTGAGTATIKAPETLSNTYLIKLQNADDESDVATVEVAVKAIILVEPKAGQSFAQGSDVNVSWRVRDDLITGVMIQVSTNNGGCYSKLNVSGQADKNEDFTWSVGSEPPRACNLTYPSTQVFVNIGDYFDFTSPGMNDVSGMLSVN